jgi:PAS domain S-box-containing protein
MKVLYDDQQGDFSKIDRKLSISFGLLIFALMGIIFLSAVSYFNYIINKEQYRLSSVIANSIGDSINRVSFSGKYQARLLIEEFAKKNPNIDQILIQEPSGFVIAHSNKQHNGIMLSDSSFEKAKNVMTSREYIIQNISLKRDGETVELIEIDMPYKKGYEEEISGVIRVFLSTKEVKTLSNNGILYFSILITFLSVLSIFIIYTLSNKIGSPIKSLAFQLKGILEYAPLAIHISNKNGDTIASSSLYNKLSASLESIQGLDEKTSKKVLLSGKAETYKYTLSINNKNSYFQATKYPIAKDENEETSLICSIAMDVTEQKEYEKKIEVLLEEQTAFFQNAVAGIIHLKGRTFIHSNEAWDEMLGYKAGELEGQNSKIIYQNEEEYQKLGENAYKEMLEAGHYTVEQELQKKDGSSIVVLLSGAYLDKNDTSKGSIWVGIDITQRKKAEEKLLLINKSLEQTVETEINKRLEAEQMALQQSKMALMGEMIGAIAHQWRQPLNALGLTIQDIKEAYKYGELDEKYIDNAISISMDRVQFMSKTIDDFRNFFSPTKSKKEFYLEDAIKATVNIVSAQLSDSNISLEYDIDGKTLFNGYQGELQQVLLNIISNAKDAMEHNKSLIKRIHISVINTQQNSFITIEDSGGGIPIHIMDRICEPYFTTKEQGKGTGVGLYMSKQIVERHMNGELIFENSNYGAKFTIKLPKA